MRELASDGVISSRFTQGTVRLSLSNWAASSPCKRLGCQRTGQGVPQARPIPPLIHVKRMFSTTVLCPLRSSSYLRFRTFTSAKRGPFGLICALDAHRLFGRDHPVERCSSAARSEMSHLAIFRYAINIVPTITPAGPLAVYRKPRGDKTGARLKPGRSLRWGSDPGRQSNPELLIPAILGWVVCRMAGSHDLPP